MTNTITWQFSWVKYCRSYTHKQVVEALRRAGYKVSVMEEACMIAYVDVSGTKEEIMQHRKNIHEALNRVKRNFHYRIDPV